MSYQHFHRRLSVPTHLDLPVEAHCRSSFFDSSRLSYPLPLCLFALDCWAAADLDAVLTLPGSGGACCPSWALILLFQALLHTRSQISLCIVRSVADFSCFLNAGTACNLERLIWGSLRAKTRIRIPTEFLSAH